MGLVLNLKKSKKTSWSLFFEHALETFKESNLIVIPIGKAGYGFIASPFDPENTAFFQQMIQEKGSSSLFFIVDEIQTAKQIAQFSELELNFVEKFWPNEIIMTLPCKSKNTINWENKSFEIPVSLWEKFDQVQIINLKHEVVQEFLTYLKSKNIPPILCGFFAEREPRWNFMDTGSLLEEFGGDEIGVILDYGRLQKGKKHKHAAYQRTTK